MPAATFAVGVGAAGRGPRSATPSARGPGAVLPLPPAVALRAIGRDPGVMGDPVLGRRRSAATLVTIVGVGACVAAPAALTVLP